MRPIAWAYYRQCPNRRPFIIIPIQCEYFALEGLGKLLNTVKIVQNKLNPTLTIEGVLLTMYDFAP